MGRFAEPQRRPRKRRTFRHDYPLKRIAAVTAGVILGLAVLGGTAYVIRGRLHHRPKPPVQGNAQKPEDEDKAADDAPDGTFRRKPVTRSVIRREDVPDAALFLSLKAPAKIQLEGLPSDSPEAKEALETMTRYQACTDWKDKLRLILLHDHSLDVLKDYYEVRQEKDPGIDGQIAGAAAMIVGDVRVVVLCYPSKDRADGVALAFFIRAMDGSLRLNWDAFVAWSDLKWKDFQRARPSEPMLLRGFVTLDDYYNYEFADGDAYLSLKLHNPDGSMMLNAFCKRQSSAGAFLKRTLKGVPDNRVLAPHLPADQRPVQNLPVAVSVRFPQNAQSDHCVELLEMVPGRWFLFEDETSLTSERYREAYEMINNLRKFMIGKEVKDLK